MDFISRYSNSHQAIELVLSQSRKNAASYAAFKAIQPLHVITSSEDHLHYKEKYFSEPLKGFCRFTSAPFDAALIRNKTYTFTSYDQISKIKLPCGASAFFPNSARNFESHDLLWHIEWLCLLAKKSKSQVIAEIPLHNEDEAQNVAGSLSDAGLANHCWSYQSLEGNLHIYKINLRPSLAAIQKQREYSERHRRERNVRYGCL